MSTLFCAIFYIFSQLGKKYAHFLPIGEKNMHFLPFFHPLSIIFLPQHVIWPHFCRGVQTEKYTPLTYLAQTPTPHRE